MDVSKRIPGPGLGDHGIRLALAAVGALGLWLATMTPVFAQEAYYWTYAQHPALSYFDHPPMVAWLIWLGTELLGDGALGVRAGTLICALGLTVVGLQMLRDLGGDRPAIFAWIGLSMGVPLLAAEHVLANPDGPLSFFWIGTLWALWRARSHGGIGWWALAGAGAGCALLSKYSALFLAVGGVIVLLCDARMRRNLRRPGPWVGLLIAAAVFSPVVIWNAQNGFESFLFQTRDRYQRGGVGLHWLLQLTLSQIGLLSPVVACCVAPALAWCWRRMRAGDARGLWLLAFGVPLPAFMFTNSLWMQVKPNWIAPAYPMILLSLLLWARESSFTLRHPLWARVGRRCAVGFAAVVAVSCVGAPLLEALPNPRGSSWSGWNEIATAAEHWESVIDDADGLEGNVFFFALDYRDAAQLGRNLKFVHARLEPEEQLEPTLAHNVVGERALQFDHWDEPARHLGQDAILVLLRPDRRTAEVEKVRTHFEQIRQVERVRVERLGRVVQEADIYLCYSYHGP